MSSIIESYIWSWVPFLVIQFQLISVSCEINVICNIGITQKEWYVDIVKHLISTPDMLYLEKLDTNPCFRFYVLFITLFLYYPSAKLSAVFYFSHWYRPSTLTSTIFARLREVDQVLVVPITKQSKNIAKWSRFFLSSNLSYLYLEFNSNNLIQTIRTIEFLFVNFNHLGTIKLPL